MNSDFEVENQDLNNEEFKDPLPKVPGYTITELIGSGGHAQVYGAIRERNGQEVAIKIIDIPNPAEKEKYLAQFKAEARLTAALENAHILPVIELIQNIKTDEPDSPEMALIVKRIHGKSLKELIYRSDVTEEEKDRYITQIGEAVSFIHKKNIRHRDLKPANVLISNSDTSDDHEFRNAVLTDFGSSLSEEIQTAPLYASPEELRGENKQPTDTFQLGVMAFELYMGKHFREVEFSGENLLDRADFKDFMLKIDGLPQLAREAVIEKYGEEFAGVLDKALSADPEMRYKDADSFVRELLASKKSRV